MRKSFKLIIVTLAASALAFTAYVAVEVNRLETTQYEYCSEKVSEPFDGFRIVQLSDLHAKRFGKRQEKLIEAVGDARPDVIVITGDIVSAGEKDYSSVIELLDGITKIAPVYYVTGNHESDGGIYEKLRSVLVEHGAVLLENKAVEIERGNERIMLYGIMDPTFSRNKNYKRAGIVAFASLSSLEFDENELNILLSHRPELLTLYSEFPVDLVLCGHAHGGQVRLPFIGALYAPGQGLFPKLTDGIHVCGDTTEIISRGLGTSVLPIRVLDTPQVVSVQLKNGVSSASDDDCAA